MKERIGFIGVGIMGKPMAGHLLQAGYPVTVYDIQSAPVQELAAKGAQTASSVKEAAGAAEIVFTSLPDGGVVEQVSLGPGGLIEAMKSGSILVETSTISPTLARRIAEKLAQRNIEMLDAPLSGGDVGAREATLAIMAGGKAEIFARVLPILQKIGRNITHVGRSGAGQVAKAANQIIVGLTIEAVAEALVFAKKAGADPEKVRQAMLGGFAQSRVLEVHGKRMTERDFRPGGRVSTHRKDTEIALAVAKELGIYLPGTMVVADLWNALTAQGGLEWDHSSLVRAIEVMSNTEVRPD